MEQLERLQAVEDGLQRHLLQKQQLQSRVMELESAANALDGTKTAYRIIGNLMVERPTEDLKKETADQLAQTRTMLESLDKQEQRLKKEAERLQKEIQDDNTTGRQ